MSSALALLNEVLPRPEAQACSCTWFLGRYWLAVGTGHNIHVFDEAETQTSCPPKRQRGIPSPSGTRHAQQQQQVLPMPDRVACTAWCNGSAVLAGAVQDEVHVFVPSASLASERANSVTWVLSAVIQLPCDASIAAVSWEPTGAWLVAAGSVLSVCAMPEQVVSAAAVGGTVTSLLASWSVRLCPGHTNSILGETDNMSSDDKKAVSSQKYVSTPPPPATGKEKETGPDCAAVLCACGGTAFVTAAAVDCAPKLWPMDLEVVRPTVAGAGTDVLACGAVAHVGQHTPELLVHTAPVLDMEWRPCTCSPCARARAAGRPALHAPRTLLTSAADGVVRIWRGTEEVGIRQGPCTASVGGVMFGGRLTVHATLISSLPSPFPRPHMHVVAELLPPGGIGSDLLVAAGWVHGSMLEGEGEGDSEDDGESCVAALYVPADAGSSHGSGWHGGTYTTMAIGFLRNSAHTCEPFRLHSIVGSCTAASNTSFTKFSSPNSVVRVCAHACARTGIGTCSTSVGVSQFARGARFAIHHSGDGSEQFEWQFSSPSLPCIWRGSGCLCGSGTEAIMNPVAEVVGPGLSVRLGYATAHASAPIALTGAPFAHTHATAFVSLGADGTSALLWDTIDAGFQPQYMIKASSDGLGAVDQPTEISAVACAADGTLVACASTDGTVSLFACARPNHGTAGNQIDPSVGHAHFTVVGAGGSAAWQHIDCMSAATDRRMPWKPRALVIATRVSGANQPKHVVALCPRGLHLQLWTVTPHNESMLQCAQQPVSYFLAPDEEVSCMTACTLPSWCLSTTDANVAPVDAMLCTAGYDSKPVLWRIWEATARPGDGQRWNIEPIIHEEDLLANAERIDPPTGGHHQRCPYSPSQQPPCSVVSATHVGRCLFAVTEWVFDSSDASKCTAKVTVWEAEGAPQPVLVFADNYAGVDAAPRLPRLKKGGVILVPMSDFNVEDPSGLGLHAAWHAGAREGAWPVLVVACGQKVMLFAQNFARAADAGATQAAGASLWAPLTTLSPVLLRLPCSCMCVCGDVLVIGLVDGALHFIGGKENSKGPQQNSNALAKSLPTVALCGITATMNQERAPLPEFHPHTIEALLLFARHEQVNDIVSRLLAALVCADDSKAVLQQQLQASGKNIIKEDDGPGDETHGCNQLNTELLRDVATRISSLPHSLPGLCHEHNECLCTMLSASAKAYGERGACLDDAGKHFSIVVSTRMAGVMTAEVDFAEVLPLTACDVCWAQCSRTQTELLDVVMPPQPCWHHVRAIGVVLWLRDRSALKQLCRRVVNVEYRHKTDNGNKDPESVALLHVALGQVRVLSQLYALAGQRKVSELIARDFSSDRWQRAALKNAHALCSKRRYALAAAFFLLAGKLSEAVKLCTGKMKDYQLACLVSRLVGGDDSSELRSILQCGRSCTNRWLRVATGVCLRLPTSLLVRQFAAIGGDENSDVLCKERELAAHFGLSWACAQDGGVMPFAKLLASTPENAAGNELAVDTIVSRDANARELQQHIALFRRMSTRALAAAGLSRLALDLLDAVPTKEGKDSDAPLQQSWVDHAFRGHLCRLTSSLSQ